MEKQKPRASHLAPYGPEVSESQIVSHGKAGVAFATPEAVGVR
ncbi:MAG: hypothetical protein BLITH_0221 [Brockia lithotrophica]|uniref:Uncharacterized protein n=1 Tax=Brockia lithotrophica TaxID=933949 RepID=A0A2T5GAD9_9BACL|nr:MAG: hypothetical protein BLITH_0221 [Brockia lithotrophica]